MKIFLFSILAFLPCVISAQDNYLPLVEKGKHWTYDNFMPFAPEYKYNYYYELKGDTLIAEKICFKMYSENRNNNNAVKYEGALYEENKKVYCFFSGKDEAELLYDFGCYIGDILYVKNEHLVVEDIYTEDNDGVTIKKYKLQPTSWNENDHNKVFWIEGVGAMLDFFVMLPLSGNYSRLNACELNGEILYQTVDPTSIDDIEYIDNFKKDTNLYDLQGRRLNGQPTKGIYIKNGKKHVIK